MHSSCCTLSVKNLVAGLGLMWITLSSPFADDSSTMQGERTAPRREMWESP